MHHFRQGGTRYQLDDVDTLHEFIDNVCDGNRDLAMHYIDAVGRGELVILNSEGAVEDMTVLCDPAARSDETRVIRWERDGHLSMLMRAFDVMELQSRQRHPSSGGRVVQWGDQEIRYCLYCDHNPCECRNPRRIRLVEP